MNQRAPNTCYHCHEGTWEWVGTGETTWGGNTVPEFHLAGVPLYRCSHCGRERTLIPNPLGLQETIKALYLHKEAPLEPLERRHLRKLVGLSVSDLAQRLGASEAKVRRWETRRDGMNRAEEIAFRVAALLTREVEDYEAHDQADVTEVKAQIAEAVQSVYQAMQVAGKHRADPQPSIEPRVTFSAERLPASSGRWG